MSKQQIIAGIDIGSSKIVTVIASLTEGDERPKIIGVAKSDSKGIKKGNVVDIDEATSSIINSVEAAERMAGFNLNKAIISVGGPLLTSQNSKGVVAISEPEEEITAIDVDRVVEAAKAISMPSSREIIHVIPRDFTVDGQEGIKDPVSMTGVRLEVETNIISGSSTAIRNLTRCVNEVGVDVQGLAVGSIACAEAILTDTEKELGVILVDIGGGTTDIVIYVDGAPFYLTVLPIGAKNVTNDLAAGLRLSQESSEILKLSLDKKAIHGNGLPDGELIGKEQIDQIEKEDKIDLLKLGIDEDVKNVSRKTVVEGIIRPRLNEIISLVGSEIKKSGTVGLTPAGVVLTGGGALTVGATDCVKKILGMPVRIGIPKGMTGLIDDIESPAYSTALGLIFYAMKNEFAASSNVSLNQISRKFAQIPQGLAGKALNLVKSLLP